MDPETRKLLEDTYSLTQENNKMLHKVRNVQKWATFMSWLKMIVLIGVTLGSFYFLEPYLNKIMEGYNSLMNLNTQQKVDAAIVEVNEAHEAYRNIGGPFLYKKLMKAQQNLKKAEQKRNAYNAPKSDTVALKIFPQF